ncbi:glycosyltransferase family 4 protein [Thermosulfurimonas marina]|uniref:Glycosyltransferase family 4 protein n=1 Tax=Thermosulfurimonas marina TaxID=2047767 RepID=A0A6H1WU83_9BACT|nr:glycosyltransferase family 4 protein [Thermosulfurimonas marina]QJA06709.1 glycosyltransferase family 4 protein [Thermosulfurimonas marina]
MSPALVAPSFFREISGEAAYARLLARALAEIFPEIRIYTLVPESPDEGYVFARAFSRKRLLMKGPAFFNRLTLWPQALFLLLRREPYLFVLHGVEAWRRYPALARWVFRKAQGFFSVSHYTARRFLAENRLQNRWFHLPPALDPAFEDQSETLQLSAPGPYLLTVARLSRSASYKGVDLVLEALARLKEEFPTLQYLVVGGGDLLPEYLARSAKLGLSSGVHFFGERRKTAPFYRVSDIFVLPSGGEGFGIAFLEAMAFKKPVIGAEAGGIPEVVQHQVNGLLVPYGNPEALTQALRRLLTDKDLARRLGEKGREILEQEYLFPRFRERLEGYLRELSWV